MQFGEAIRVCFQKYATFSGRASRSEFWYFALFGTLVTIVVGIIDAVLFPSANVLNGPVSWIASVVLFLPELAVTSRRLHDTDKSGWLQLLALTLVGFVPLIIWWASLGTAGDNRYGPNPLSGAKSI